VLWWWRFKGNVLGHGFPPRAPEFDVDGLMVPPWVRWPGFNLCQMGFREGWGGDYTQKFCEWWGKQSDEIRARVQARYPASESLGWSDFYDQLRGREQSPSR
jgi:hypothetical protein